MHWLDLTIIAAYFVGVFSLALALRRRASRSLESYFLGDRSMRWWLLGASGMASNVDMAGTMLAASILMVFGFTGFWIGLRGDIVLIMAFYMVFMGKWTRRSGKMTVAEWMRFRFGPGLAGDLPRLLTAIFNVVFLVWVMAYFGVATNKFFAALLPADLAPINLAGITLTRDAIPVALSTTLILSTMVYTALAGLYGVVWTDVFQGVLILFMALWLSIQALVTVSPEQLAALTGPGWGSLLPTWTLRPPPVGYEELEYLGVALLFYLLKTVIDGLSGAGGYIAQRYFAAPSERDCAYLSLFWIVLMAFRWPMMMAIAVLGLSLAAHWSDPEYAMPVVLQQLTPVGVRGLLVVALLAAAMSTYSGFINAGSSYFVRDLYQAFLRPAATDRELVWMGYGASVVFVMLGLVLAYFTPSINSIWNWLNMGLGAGVLLPNLLRWYWWRLNGYGYAAGAAAGMVVALGLHLLRTELPAWAVTPYATFIWTVAGSLLAIIVVSLATAPAPRALLLEFYRTTRPFGLWGPIAREVAAVERADIRRENARDLVALLLAVPWQLVLFLVPMCLVVRQWGSAAGLAGLLLVLSVGLYFAWLRHIPRAREAHAISR
ncbi:MAG: sodium:solute symporter [Phycisphaerales bacterium]|nr:sodium:solute symporter [Phycisphaerales bacterium]